MISRSFLRGLLVLAGLVSAGEAALAQSAACQRYQAELASLPRGGGRQAAAAAERQRVEIVRMSQYYRSIGCDRGAFGFFGGPPPAECGSIAQRIRQMEAGYAQLAAQADGSGVEMRRRQLQAAVDQTCGVQQEAARPRGFFEQLFGAPQQAEPPRYEPEEEMAEEEPALGGRRLVCVRSCDGFYFPLSTSPNGRESADAMCQALCPGTETAAFAMPGSDDALNRAVSLRGQPYAQTPNAFKFQKSFDPSCSCKRNGENWAQILRDAESMLDQRRGDILVTAQKAEEMSRPKAAAPQPNTPPQTPRDRKAAEKRANDAAEAQAAAEAGAAAPTASGESAGIGPKAIEANRVVARDEGERREVAAPGGKRAVRVIAPNVIPVPQPGAR